LFLPEARESLRTVSNMSHIEVKALEIMGVQIKAKTEDKKDVKVTVDEQGRLQFFLPKQL